jgi:hypothetical protein
MLTSEQKELVQKWIDALRSGNYQQGQRRLRRVNNTYCCLGVLCDIVDPTKWVLVENAESFVFGQYSMAYLPPGILDMAGLLKVGETLVRLNDYEGKSFTEIADYIETNLLNT